MAVNQDNTDNLDSFFNNDNSWMNDINKKNTNINKRKGQMEGNEIGNRVFSLTGFNKKIDSYSEFENNFRKPLQGRENKKSK